MIRISKREKALHQRYTYRQEPPLVPPELAQLDPALSFSYGEIIRKLGEPVWGVADSRQGIVYVWTWSSWEPEYYWSGTSWRPVPDEALESAPDEVLRRSAEMKILGPDA